ncbi:MAG: hypothetical protein HQ567_33515 [Candidatus Nealsonbacteria bacterium]|nr:hypothetical protein [Candidatus Nealsonbacteria bacterium]
MPITITSFTDEHVSAVTRFNARLTAGGMRSQFPTSPVPRWLPPAPGRTLYQEYFVGVDEDSVVRSAYILKHQDFIIKDRVVSIGDFQLPISEGAVNRAYVDLASQLLLDALRKSPLLYGLGMGGHHLAITRLFKAAGWLLFAVPFYFKVNHPTAFFRKTVFLRNSLAKRLLLDCAAVTGLGWVGIKTIQAMRDKQVRRKSSVTAERVDEFDAWADGLWENCKGDYPMIAVRDAEVLQILYPKEDPRFICLKIRENHTVIGWAVVLDTPMTAHKHFGSMRLGSLVDAMASPANASKVVSAATAHLEERGVDLIVSNQSHSAWCTACQRAGFFRGPSNFLFGGSRKLRKLLDSSSVPTDQIYVNRGDGDGPIHL